ncbi:ring-opening amidohydrolase [Frankia sp. AgB32]|uniref:ring-opening amidohydrolase n=1 Tax=Frankia sp. AgB32 TaxID=631119 RepID=UPI00200ECB97|nr:ring-opening amidohydrolase [Frankia sp. AgB32]MCK9897846.1 ring-opening amidohydrolase [Frankia sp. AgB32]
MTSKCEVVVLRMLDPSIDVPELERALARSAVGPGELIAIVGKTGGRGSGDDPLRAGVERQLRSTLAAHLALRVDDVEKQIPIMLSGGSYGPLTPNIALFIKKPVTTTPDVAAVEPGVEGKSLVAGWARTPPLAPEDLGRPAQVDAVATAVEAALLDAGSPDPSDVHAVLVKGPAMTEARIRDAHARSRSVITDDPDIDLTASTMYTNDASALGVAVALGEVDRAEAMSERVIRHRWDLFSAVALASSAGEKTGADVLVLGNALDAASDLVVGHDELRSPIDVEGIHRALRRAGLEFDAAPSAAQRGDIVHVLIKMVLPADSVVLGETTALADADDPPAVAKTMAATLAASVTGHTRNYVSGGELDSHQGAPGASPVVAIVRRTTAAGSQHPGRRR